MTKSRLLKMLLALILLTVPIAGFAQEEEATSDSAIPEVVVTPDEMVAETAPPAEEKEVGKLAVLISKIKQGKTTGYVLLILSVAAVTIVLERLAGLRRSKIVPQGFSRKADTLYREGKFDELKKLCASQPSVLATIVEELVVMRGGGMEEARLLADDVGGFDLKQQQQRNYPLLVIGSVAPLLGLMGTVFGMIRAFEDVAALGSLGDPRVLADGISQALITTAMGLVVAIPSLILYHFFKTRLVGSANVLQKQVTELIRRWYGSKVVDESVTSEA